MKKSLRIASFSILTFVALFVVIPNLLALGQDRAPIPPGAEDWDVDQLRAAARKALTARDFETAAALYDLIPASDRSYSRVQRSIGWDIYGRGLGDFSRGVPHVNRALLTDPFGGNAWQDFARVYAGSLGIPVKF